MYYFAKPILINCGSFEFLIGLSGLRKVWWFQNDCLVELLRDQK